jgi:hypothetical protein
VRARVGDPAHPHEPAGVRRGAARDARNAAVAARECREEAGRAVGHLGVAGALHDRGERAVDVAQDGGALRRLGERPKRGRERLGRGGWHAP